MNASAIVAAIGHRWGSRVGGGSPPANQAPTVSASNQSVNTGAAVSITASGVDVDGTIASYAWTKQSGTASPTLSGASTATLTFTAPGSADTLVYRCTVTDNLGATGFCDVTITVSSGTGTNAPFAPSLEIPTGGTGQFTLNWTTPSTTVSGGPLSGGDALTSYSIYYSTSQATLLAGGGTLYGTAPGAGATSQVVTVAANTYWVAMRANNAYSPSDLSNAFSVTVT